MESSAQNGTGGEPRRPGAVPDAVAAPHRAVRVDVRGGVDSDGDGRPDTLLVGDGDDLLVHTDLDGDGLSDQLLAVAADGAVHEVGLDDPDTLHCLPDEL